MKLIGQISELREAIKGLKHRNCSGGVNLWKNARGYYFFKCSACASIVHPDDVVIKTKYMGKGKLDRKLNKDIPISLIPIPIKHRVKNKLK